MTTAMQQLFTFEDSLPLTVLNEGGQPWFVASEVCKVLDIKNHRDAVARLDADEKGVATTDTLGGRQQVATVNESGLYALIFTSRKEGARRFQKWITGTVIPAIRQHGGYVIGMEKLNDAHKAETVQAIQTEAGRVRERHYQEKEDRAVALRVLRRLGR